MNEVKKKKMSVTTIISIVFMVAIVGVFGYFALNKTEGESERLPIDTNVKPLADGETFFFDQEWIDSEFAKWESYVDKKGFNSEGFDPLSFPNEYSQQKDFGAALKDYSQLVNINGKCNYSNCSGFFYVEADDRFKNFYDDIRDLMSSTIGEYNPIVYTKFLQLLDMQIAKKDKVVSLDDIEALQVRVRTQMLNNVNQDHSVLDYSGQYVMVKNLFDEFKQLDNLYYSTMIFKLQQILGAGFFVDRDYQAISGSKFPEFENDLVSFELENENGYIVYYVADSVTRVNEDTYVLNYIIKYFDEDVVMPVAIFQDCVDYFAYDIYQEPNADAKKLFLNFNYNRENVINGYSEFGYMSSIRYIPSNDREMYGYHGFGLLAMPTDYVIDSSDIAVSTSFNKYVDDSYQNGLPINIDSFANTFAEQQGISYDDSLKATNTYLYYRFYRYMG